ncbi:UDP-N-acetylmuramoyl-L-alanine--D-glutamate ligase [Candidatus Daviesbacteria bacterium]|nr:UDP-N-acetylmuramoyl-L-alanine--D-glutamate ligase [Candidatus Daviesbacteria bacterium]
MDSKYKNKKILIFGLGLNQGGVGSAKFFAKQGAQVRVTDLKTTGVLKPSLDELKEFPRIEYTLGEHKNEDIDWANLIIKNPGVKPGNKYIEYAKSKGKRVEMDMGILLEYVKPSQIIGVTGTKGKSTTSSLIYEALNSTLSRGAATIPPPRWNYKTVAFAGNIGRSVLDTIKSVKEDTLVVLEISSFQLESFDSHKVSPKWAVITNITPDHLNYYQTMDEYIEAKKVIGKYQTSDDFLFIRKNDPVTNREEFLQNLGGKIIRFSSDELPKDFHPKLLGEHNKLNMAAALAVLKTFGIDEKKVLQVMEEFPGVEFRMQLIKEWQRIKIINDTTATSPEAAIRALETFPNCILIAGGMNKNMHYESFAKAADDLAREVYFLEGDSTDLIKSLMKEKNKIKGAYNDLEKLLSDVKESVKEGDVILFSPAATSFNLFQNEFDRGRKFNLAVEKMFNETK